VKTTELYIEQVLVGSLVIAVLLLPWLPELIQSVKSLETAGAIIGGSAWLGVSFMIGVPFDRLADTLTARMERFALLFAALGSQLGERFPPDRPEPSRKLAWDLFRADDQLIAALQWGAEPIADRIDYHRARIRISRALSVFCPALTLTVTVGVSRCFMLDPLSGLTKFDKPWINLDGMSVLCALFSLAIVLISYVTWCVLVGRSSPLPRTNDKCLRPFAFDFEWLTKEGGDIIQKGNTAWLAPGSGERRTFIPAATPVVFAGCFAFATGPALVSSIAVFGAAATVLSFWSFWRVSETYLTFLFQVSVVARRNPARQK
jgi:hypothetical protein